MTKSDPGFQHETSAKRIYLRAAVIAFAVLFLGAAIGGYLVAHFAEPGSRDSQRTLIAVGSMALALLAGGLVARKSPHFTTPVGPRVAASRRILWISIGIGLALGFVMPFISPDPSQSLFSYQAPLPPLFAAVLLAGLIPTTWMTWRWYTIVDEHEAAALSLGGNLAVNGMFVIAIGWWLAWRGGFAPEPDGQIVFWTTMVLWGGGYLWGRFR